jgi:hypothetical protein
MTSYRAITVGTLLALTVSVAGPATAAANSLLSGYGGPGQGNQELLGSTLLNGPSGGGGGGSSSTAAPEPAPVEGSTSAGSSGAPGVSTSKAHAGKGGHGASAGGSSRHGRAGSSSRSAAGASAAPAQRAAPDISTAADVGSQTLGLSGADLLYVLLALATLAATGALTARLTRRVS